MSAEGAENPPVTVGPAVPISKRLPESVIERSRVIGDAFDRYIRTADGTQYLGNGTNEPDISTVITSAIYDHFNRPDGALGVAPSGGAWLASGSAPPTISNNTMVSAGVGYAMQDAGVTPESIVVEWTIEPGDPDGLLAIICSIDAGIGLLNMLHILTSSTGTLVQLRQAGGSFDTIGSQSYTLATDGVTIHRIIIAILGDIVYLVYPNGQSEMFSDSRISDLVGPRVILEPINNGGQQPKITGVVVNIPTEGAQPPSGYATAADLAKAAANKISTTGDVLLTGDLTLAGNTRIKTSHASGSYVDNINAGTAFVARNDNGNNVLLRVDQTGALGGGLGTSIHFGDPFFGGHGLLRLQLGANDSGGLGKRIVIVDNA